MRFILIASLSCLMASFSHASPMQQIQPWLGVAIDVDPKGVLIKAVLDNTPAQRAGLHEGDCIVKIDDTPVKSRDEMLGILRSKGVGNTVVVHFLRQTKTQQLPLKLEALPDSLELVRRQVLNKPAPPFEVQNLADNKIMKSQDFKGKVVILEFWATWCPACRAAMPQLNQWAKLHPEAVVIGISDEEVSVLKSFLQHEPLAYKIARDPSNKIQSNYQAASIPAFFLIDSQSQVVDVAIGGGSYLESLLQHANNLLGKKK